MLPQYERITRLINEEFSSLSKSYYNHFSQIYPERYKSKGNTEDGTNLFDAIESYYQKEYLSDFKLNKHFSIHSKWLFYLPTQDFGFSAEAKSIEDVSMLYPELSKEFKNYYDFITSNTNLIFGGISNSRNISSTILKNKFKTDVELFAEYTREQLKAFFKRFFIRGGYDEQWITIDLLNHYGIDKFPHCLDEDLKSMPYSIKTGIEWNGLGSRSDEFNITLNDEEQKRKDEIELKYYLDLKSRINKLDYNDVLKNPTINWLFNSNRDFIIYTYTHKLGKVPFFRLEHNSIKKTRNPIFWKEVEKARRLNDYERGVGQINPELNEPHYSPFRFKLDADEFITDSVLLHDYLASFNEPENKIREILNLPKIGEGWISETNLYYEIKNHFTNEFVVQHGKPKWLGKQHLDIYFPKHNIAIEFQGDQHYYPVEFFGGEVSFEKNKQRDERKRVLCKENNCYLIYVNPNYKIENVIDEISSKIIKVY